MSTETEAVQAMNIPVPVSMYARIQKFREATGIPYTELFRNMLKCPCELRTTGALPDRVNWKRLTLFTCTLSLN